MPEVSVTIIVLLLTEVAYRAFGSVVHLTLDWPGTGNQAFWFVNTWRTSVNR